MPAITSAPPVALGRYVLAGEFTPGPDGPVHPALDRRTGARVAVTVLVGLASDPDGHHRAARAFRAAAGLRHPNILRTLDYGLDGRDGYAVAEAPEGQTLARTVAGRGRLAEADVVRLAAELADALEYAHADRVYHDALTPDRVFVRPDGTAVVGGFGHAAAAGRRGATAAEDVADLAEVVHFARTGRAWPEGFEQAGGVSGVVGRGADPDPARRPATAVAFARLLGEASGDRRGATRHPVTPGVIGVVGGDDPTGRWPVIVQDVSAGGVGLLIGRRVEPGTELRVALGGGDPVRARVVRVGAKAFGHWFHGCAFAAPLAEADLRNFLRRADGAVLVP